MFFLEKWSSVVILFILYKLNKPHSICNIYTDLLVEINLSFCNVQPQFRDNNGNFNMKESQSKRIVTCMKGLANQRSPTFAGGRPYGYIAPSLHSPRMARSSEPPHLLLLLSHFCWLLLLCTAAPLGTEKNQEINFKKV